LVSKDQTDEPKLRCNGMTNEEILFTAVSAIAIAEIDNRDMNGR
jgi:hypothetical protein